MKTFLKVSLIIVLSLTVVAASLFITYIVITKDAKLNKNKLLNPNQNIVIIDDEGNEVISASVSNKHNVVSADIPSFA